MPSDMHSINFKTLLLGSLCIEMWLYVQLTNCLSVFDRRKKEKCGIAYRADLLFSCCIFCSASGFASIMWLKVPNMWSPTSGEVTFVLTTLSRMLTVIDRSFCTNLDDLEVIFLTFFITSNTVVGVSETWK